MDSHSAVWVTSKVAAEILSTTNKRVVNPSYVYTLARRKQIRTKPLIGRVCLYSRSDCARYRLRAPKGAEVH